MSRIETLVCACLVVSSCAPVALAQRCPWEGDLEKIGADQIFAPEGMHLAMCNAYAMSDPVDRDVAIRETLVTYLLGNDIGQVNLALEYLSRNQRWLDLTPFSDVFATLAERPGRVDEGSIPMWSYLRRVQRSERVALYREALVTGTAKVGSWDRPFARENAIMWASLDGVDELREQIEKAYPESRADFQQRKPLEAILLTLDCRSGGVDELDAANKAAQRFAATSPVAFRDRMERDPVFARVLDETVTEVCAINPYDGRQPTGCGSILELYVHQNALVLSLRQQAPVPGDAIAGVDRDSLPKWLRNLGGITLEGEYFSRVFEKRCTDTAMSWNLEKCLQTEAPQGE
jgi:hypothetical protein